MLVFERHVLIYNHTKPDIAKKLENYNKWNVFNSSMTLIDLNSKYNLLVSESI